MDDIQSFGDRISEQALKHLSVPSVKGLCQFAAGFFATYLYHLYLDSNNCKRSRCSQLAVCNIQAAGECGMLRFNTVCLSMPKSE